MAAHGNARAFLILNTLSARNQSDFDKIIQTKRAEACIAEDQGACASGNGWSLPRPYIPIHRPAQASIAIAAANGALGREVQNARRSRTDRMENKPKNNKVWNVKVCKRATCPANPK